MILKTFVNKLFHVKRYGYEYPLHYFHSVSRFNRPNYTVQSNYRGILKYLPTIQKGERIIYNNINSLPFLERFNKKVINSYIDEYLDNLLFDDLQNISILIDDLIKNGDSDTIINILKELDEFTKPGGSKKKNILMI